ncbi:MAG: hypothetical protein K2G93_05090 [Rikenella sp.]|nr:hypothetical protein [Rikenella sp.]
MYYVGRSGYSWSSTASDIMTYFLYFNYSVIYPNRNDHRSYGFQLRCLQE